MTEVSDDRLAAWRTLLLAHWAVMHAVERDVSGAPGSIPMRWYDVLLELRYAPERRYHMQELAEHVVLSRSRVSRVVDELETAGFVERSRCPADRRAFHVTLTGNGAAALRKAAPIYLEAVERHFTAHLTERDRRYVVKGLTPVLEAHGRSGEAPGGGVRRARPAE